MIHGIRYVRQDVTYISKKHTCPICNAQLNVVKVSKIINSKSEEAHDLPPIVPRTVIGRGVKFRNYNAVGNIKWIWKQFECPHCQHRFTVEQLKQIESSTKENWNAIISSFDEPPMQVDEEISMQQKKQNKLKLALLITIPIIIAFALAIWLIIELSSSNFIDTNGPDNFALTEITREDILESDKNYKSSMEVKKRSGSRTYVVGTRFREYDRDNINISYGKLYGVTILQATKIFSNSLTLNISSSIESGNAEIIVVIDGEYYCSVNINQDQSISLQNISGKEVIIKLAGEDAKIKVDIVRTY